MVYGFFADDASGYHAALLAAAALARVERPATVLAYPGHAPGPAAPAGRRPPALVAHGAAAQLQGLLDRAAAALAGGSEVFLVLPLAALDEDRVRARLGVAVVTGMSPLHAARALRAVAHAAAPAGRGPPPPWLLPWSAAPSGCRRLEGRPRTLPVRLAPPGRADLAALAAGTPAASLLRSGTLLMAVLEAAAADPDAQRLDAAALGEALSPAGSPADQATAERLRDLAESFARLGGDGSRAARAPRRAPPPRRRRPGPRVPGRRPAACQPCAAMPGAR